MTISIHIEAHPDRGDMRVQIDQALSALGFQRETADIDLPRTQPAEPIGGIDRSPNANWRNASVEKTATEVAAETEETETADENRPRGKPSEGRARRTKAEMAEDDELEKLAVASGVPLDKLDSVIGQVGRAKAIEGLKERIKAAGDKPAISTGEERVGPEDDPETEAQDAADEADEVEAARDPETPLTVDDLKNAMGAYVQKFGLAETQEDGAKLFVDALGAPPEGNAYWKVTLVAEQGQKTLQKAIDAWKAAAATDKRYVAKGA